MKTTFISTHAIGEATRANIMRSQTRLAKAQSELSSGQIADIGEILGGRSAGLVHMRHELEQFSTLQQTNEFLTTRLEVTQNSLQAIVEDAQNFVAELIGARNAIVGPEIIQAQGQGRLSSLIDTLGTGYDGGYVFSGINSGQSPLIDYWDDPPPASRTSVAAAFSSTFGFSQDDTSVKDITEGQMTSFLDGPFGSVFSDADWTANWSRASSQVSRTKISVFEIVEYSVSANESAFKKLARVYTAAADLGTEKLNRPAFQVLVDSIAKLAGEAVQELTSLQARLGTVQERVSKSSERLVIQSSVITERIGRLEEVDPYEVSTRVNSLLNQIELSYAVTARIQRLSILNFI